jgi:prepilin-type N-terminal cleavage/methylation domain-containing protein
MDKKMLAILRKHTKRLLNSQKGFALLEIIVSIALLSTIGVGILNALGTTSRSLVTADEQETGKNIAEMEMEYIKNLPFASSYQPRNLGTDYPGYSIVTQDDKIFPQIITNRTDGNIQKIEITVRHNSKNVITVYGYKVR